MGFSPGRERPCHNLCFGKIILLQGGRVGGGGWARLEGRRQGGRGVGEGSEASTGNLAIPQLQEQQTSS